MRLVDFLVFVKPYTCDIPGNRKVSSISAPLETAFGLLGNAERSPAKERAKKPAE